MIMLTIEESISKAYYDDEDGLGSMNKTLTEAKDTTKKSRWMMSETGSPRT